MYQLIKPLWKVLRGKGSYKVNHLGSDRSELIFESILNDGDININNHTIDVLNGIGVCKGPFPQLLDGISAILSFLWKEILLKNKYKVN